ncbi:hypothetical protein K443DRAFT_525305 [Laccaria amethystina LaAM-08-1]|uniref:Uncharacterized protein n=1 Tax=Laccaria amethystina LaAM-08-1 TaxID=1095629 RepID=A0A0C9WLX2_9AGAR|nr:hypothetical protein K443DRAFT_525305 [Laccaria amethystina LaAM-08-1]
MAILRVSIIFCEGPAQKQRTQNASFSLSTQPAPSVSALRLKIIKQAQLGNGTHEFEMKHPLPSPDYVQTASNFEL